MIKPINWIKKQINKVFSKSRMQRLWSFASSVIQFVGLGAKQMFAYMGNYVGMWVSTSIGITWQFISILKTLSLNKTKGWKKWLAIIVAGLGMVSFVGVALLFIGKPFFGLDIHAAEYAARGFYVISEWIAGGDILSIIFGTFTGLFIHKLLVNKGSGLPAMDSRTDDPTGKTWSGKIFGKTIKVPRNNQKVRLTFAILGIILGGIWILMGKDKEEKKDKIEIIEPKIRA